MGSTRLLYRRAIAAGIAFAGLAITSATADQYDPPAGYYSSAVSTGAALELQLHNIIDGHISRSYGDARFALPLLDEDPNNASNILLVYNGQSVSKTWDSGATWNREHTWPRSRGVDSSGPDNSDLHMLRGCNSSVNGSRGNKPYNNPTTTQYWDPGQIDQGDNDWRGEMSRAMFYADIRYDGSDSNTNNLQLVHGFPGTNQMGDLTALLRWHYEEPVKATERRRNHLIGTQAANPLYYQGNRNPFIDHPEFVWAIWGGSPNDSTLFVGANPNVDGSSDSLIDLGRIIAGSAPAATSVNVMKIGADPTTWETFVVGDLLDNEAMTHQAFTSGSQMSSIPLVFGSTASTGMASGQIVIDNTDLTSAGAGQGVSDADDTITVMAEIVDHSTGSFDDTLVDLVFDIDFGDVQQGSFASPGEFEVFNIAGDPLFTADLVVGTITPSGDSGVLTIDLLSGTSIAAGLMASSEAFVDTSAALGAYSATYTIEVGDESIPGALSGASLTLNLTANLIVGSCAADINGDGAVDTADLGILVAAFGNTGMGLPADLNGDDVVDTADLGILISEFSFLCN